MCARALTYSANESVGLYSLDITKQCNLFTQGHPRSDGIEHSRSIAVVLLVFGVFPCVCVLSIKWLNLVTDLTSGPLRKYGGFHAHFGILVVL